jgi:hypothetical protein
MDYEVYDIECLSNLFTYTGYDLNSKEYFQFVIHDSKNDYELLYNHLRGRKLVQIGFNNEGYDYPVIHHLLNHYDEYVTKSGHLLSQCIYQKSQEVIMMEFSEIADKNKFIQQIDLYKIHHLNNKARICSLKQLEVYMRMRNVEEMPFNHTHWCSEEDIKSILLYNLNDVKATTLFFFMTIGKTDNPIYKGKDKISLRLNLNKKYKLGCLNFPDVKIGEQLILKLYCDKTGSRKWDIKQLKSPRNSINLKECVPKWVAFKTKEFNQLLNKINSTVISNTKGEFNESVIFHNIKMEYGTGGLHSNADPGIYKSNDEWIIYDQDVGSLYPSLAVTLGLYPEHLGKIFTEIYNEIVSTRLKEKKKPKKERDMVIMEGFKLAANGIYGKSGEESSFLYDPLYTMKTTIAGQLFLSMFTEKLVNACPEIKFIQHNTDGLTYLVKRSHLSLIKEVTKEMEDLTGLYIEDNIYNLLVMRDVNSYLARYESGDVKYKGIFEIDSECYKNPSMRIVPLALSNYFLNNIPVSETIYNHKDIFDFCMLHKSNSNFISFMRNGEDIIKLDRITRYYISNKGYELIKIKSNGKDLNLSKFNQGENRINVGYRTTLFNKYIELPIDKYDINYKFYIRECNKIIDIIEPKQMVFDFWKL